MSKRVAISILYLAAGLLGACNQQYIAVPGAELVPGSPNYTYDNAYTVSLELPYTFVEGSPDLTVCDSTTVQVDFSVVTEFEVTELVFLDLVGASEFYNHWRIDLTEEEMAAGSAEIEVFALDEKPKQEWCERDYRGVGRCYQESNEGLTGMGLAAAGDNTTTWATVLPLTLPPLVDDGLSDACASYTFADCCEGTSGISVIQCAWDPSCDCPAGTSYAGTDSSGYALCDCPQ